MPEIKNKTPEILTKPPIHPNNFHDINPISYNYNTKLSEEICKLQTTNQDNPEKNSKIIYNISINILK